MSAMLLATAVGAPETETEPPFAAAWDCVGSWLLEEPFRKFGRESCDCSL